MTDRAELRARLNKPVVVSPHPSFDHFQREDEAIQDWWRDIFEYFDVDPKRRDAWELIAWHLARAAFPKFDVVGASRQGRPRTSDKIDDLLVLFEAEGSTYKQFLRDHEQRCLASGIKSPGSLKDTIFRARRRRTQRAQNEALRRHGLLNALGVNPFGFVVPG
jgi:hypothetical protein